MVLSAREVSRIHLLGCVVEGQLPLHDAAVRLRLSLRQARRLLRRLQREGPASLAHGNRGRSPHNKTPEATRQRILKWVGDQAVAFNDTHLAELLATRFGISIGRETLRCILRGAGLPPKRRRRPKLHRSRRLRSASKGLMVIWDGSPHHWFGPDRPACTLMAAIDDADSELLDAFFAPRETSEAYLRLLQGVLRRRGIPLVVYQDRHSALRRNDDHWSLEEELQGSRRPTQVGLALRDLAVQPIFALSPQAKGRVERLFGVLQDRLVAEMALEGIGDIAAGNAYLRASGIRRYNQRFSLSPANARSSFRSPAGLDLKRILSFRYEATVSNDHRVSVGGLLLSIPPGPQHRGYAGARVDVRQHLDGSWSVYYRDRPIARHAPTPLAEPLRYRRRKRGQGNDRPAHEDVLLYNPNPTPLPEDIFARQLGGHIAPA